MDMDCLTRQSLTDEEYLTLFGICQWVFNSNCHFIIEMVDKEHHGQSDETWFALVGLTAGRLAQHKGLINSILGTEIYNLFEDIKDRRNKIIHSFPTGEKKEGYYVAMYRSSIIIDKDYLKAFIRDNQALSTLIYQKRAQIEVSQNANPAV